MRPGESFEDPDVASCYRHRPPYADGVHARLVELCPNHEAILDLGCGNGKLARRLAGDFGRITAIDASHVMLDSGKNLPNGDAANIDWRCGLAETVAFDGPYDLVVAGASIHWMDHAVVFPRLARQVARHHVFATVDGDGAHEPPWDDAYTEFLKRWIPRAKGGEPYSPGRFDQFIRAYERWVSIEGEETFDSTPFTQTVDDFIACQHSRNTFARAALGAQSRVFDAKLVELLAPHATDGCLTYVVQTRLTWGRITDSPI